MHISRWQEHEPPKPDRKLRVNPYCSMVKQIYRVLLGQGIQHVPQQGKSPPFTRK